MQQESLLFKRPGAAPPPPLARAVPAGPAIEWRVRRPMTVSERSWAWSRFRIQGGDVWRGIKPALGSPFKGVALQAAVALGEAAEREGRDPRLEDAGLGRVGGIRVPWKLGGAGRAQTLTFTPCRGECGWLQNWPLILKGETGCQTHLSGACWRAPAAPLPVRAPSVPLCKWRN